MKPGPDQRYLRNLNPPGYNQMHLLPAWAREER